MDWPALLPELLTCFMRPLLLPPNLQTRRPFLSVFCAGLVDWPALLPELLTRFMWAFEVPVGAATGSPPFCECLVGALAGPGGCRRCCSVIGWLLPSGFSQRLQPPAHTPPKPVHPPTPPSGAYPPAAYPAPGLCQLLFQAEQKSRSSCIAKATIYLLGRTGGAVGQEDPGGCWRVLPRRFFLRL